MNYSKEAFYTTRAMNIYFLLIVMMSFTFQIVSCAFDTMNATRTLREGETMISSGGSFELGFFSPGNSKNRYVGIWYKKITVRTVVWVANRDFPLTNGSGVLRLINPGILVLQDEGGGVIWSTNASNTVPNPVAQLLDSGNLAVKDANDDFPESFLWQSFNYPTDTFLPGMKLGWNFVTRLEVYLSSWKSNENPATGDYTFHCDPTGYPQFIIKKGGVEVYRFGPILNDGLVINKNEVYYRDELLNSSIISRVFLDPDGLARRWKWIDQTQDWTDEQAPLDNCDNYKLCGAYGTCDVANSPACLCLDKFVPKDPEGWHRGDRSNGCVRRKELNCEKGDGFIPYSVIKLPDTRLSWFNESITLEECEMLCAHNCSCMAYTSPDIVSRGVSGSGCLLWYDELVDIKELSPQGENIYIRMASSELGKKLVADAERKERKKRKKREILITSVSLATGLVLLGVILLLYAWRRKKIDSRQRKIGTLERLFCFVLKIHRIRLSYANNHGDEKCNKDLELPLFDLRTISKATDKFSDNNKLGEGGFGPVYKGILEEGHEIAVKRLSRTSFQGVDEFKNEVICIAKLQHRNLVKLLGCCIQGEESILVYEYMINKSLDLILFDPEKSALLDWPNRFHIINGVARGLMYLHQDSRLRIIHRDLKASNILLDSDMNPKISDFGLARICAENETGANTKRVVGTYGYMSPEYAADGLFSVKSDVFSFGVLVLEIVTGKRNRGLYHRDHHLNLLGYMWALHIEGRPLDLLDSYVGSSHNISEITRSIHIGLLCVQQRPEDRPTMSSVISMLGSEIMLPEAKQPGFFTGWDKVSVESPVSANKGNSVNEMSVTQTTLQGR